MISHQINKLVSSSTKILLNLNDASNLCFRIPQADSYVSSLTREGFCAFYAPLLLIESLADLSEYFLLKNPLTRIVNVLGSAASGQMYQVTVTFQASESVIGSYKEKHSNAVWLLHQTLQNGGPDPQQLRINSNLIHRSSIFAFVRSFKIDKENVPRERSVPIWPSVKNKQPESDSNMVLVTALVYTNSQQFDRLFTENDSQIAMSFVGNISTLVRGLRILSIPSLPSDIDSKDDYNVSPIYDCIIDNSKFAMHIYENLHSFHDKFNALMSSDEPSILIVDGGPGSGKSTTAINEIVNHLDSQVRQRSKVNILMCASSNAAADVLFEKLTDRLPNLKVCRVGDKNKFKENVKERMEDIENTLYDELRLQEDKVMEKYGEPLTSSLTRKILLKNSAVIIVTLGSSQSPELVSIRKEVSFDLLLIDEAGQAKIEDLLLPLYFTSITRILLVGDPRQIGPTCKSTFLSKFPAAATSIFVRLCNTLKLSSNCVHQIRVQFRMHPEVADIVNSISYSEEDKLETSPDGKWKKIDMFSPLFVFSSPNWAESISLTTYSRLSQEEAEFSVRLAKALLTLTEFDFKSKTFPNNMEFTITIIPLYNAQVQLIRKILKENYIDRIIKVQTVDQMQGSECDFAIVSAVRASTECTSLIGFASDIRRLNVALSRAGAVYVLAKAATFRTQPGWSKLFVLAGKKNLFFPKANLLNDDASTLDFLQKHQKH